MNRNFATTVWQTNFGRAYVHDDTTVRPGGVRVTMVAW